MENTTATLTDLVSELNNMIITGQVLDAFEKFYAEEVTMQENEEAPTVGKAACRTHEEAFVNGITAFRKAEVKNVLVSDNITVVEWDFDFSHKDWGDRNYTQVAVQRWNDAGQIVNEKFYYNH
tara:strand:+ start:2650 stop:3018 length:369 start_codon:yes stop_codon:yes gene_type:complete